MKEIYNLLAIVEIGEQGEEKKEKIKQLVKKEASFLFEKEIGEQEFAYEINDHNKGFYFWIDFNIQTNQLEKLKNKLEDINPIRCLISKKLVEAVKRQKEEVEESLTEKMDTKSTTEKDKTKPKKKTGKKGSQTENKKTKKEHREVGDEVKDEKKRMEDLDKKLKELL